jgi:hypothetical protein
MHFRGPVDEIRPQAVRHGGQCASRAGANHHAAGGIRAAGDRRKEIVVAMKNHRRPAAVTGPAAVGQQPPARLAPNIVQKRSGLALGHSRQQGVQTELAGLDKELAGVKPKFLLQDGPP